MSAETQDRIDQFEVLVLRHRLRYKKFDRGLQFKVWLKDGTWLLYWPAINTFKTQHRTYPKMLTELITGE